jgi:selenocysteine-specific elongation factor
VEKVVAHTRAALNLGDIHYKDLHRGDLVFGGMDPGEPGRRVLARLTFFEEDWEPSPRHMFHLHHLAAHRNARMIQRDGDFAVLELDRAYPFWALDRGLLRDGTPLRVHAGFSVIHPNLTRFRRRELVHLLEDPPEDNLLSWQHWFARVQQDMIEEEAFLRACGEPVLEEVREELVQLSDGRFLNRAKWEQGYADFITVVEACHQALPIYSAVPVNRVKAESGKKKIPDWLLDIFFREAAARGDIDITGDRLKRHGFSPKWTPHRKERLHNLIKTLEKGPLAILDARLIARDPHVDMILDLLTWERYLVPLTADLWIRHDFLDRICATLHQRFAGGSFSVGELKEMFGMTRKYAIPLLEYLDKQGCTRRTEEGRLWVAGTAPVVGCTWRRP